MSQESYQLLVDENKSYQLLVDENKKQKEKMRNPMLYLKVCVKNWRINISRLDNFMMLFLFSIVQIKCIKLMLKEIFYYIIKMQTLVNATQEHIDSQNQAIVACRSIAKE